MRIIRGDKIAGALEGDVVHGKRQMPVGGNHRWAVKALLLGDQCHHFAGLVLHGHFRDPRQRRYHDGRHLALPVLVTRSASIASKRSMNSLCASVEGSGVMVNMSRVMPRGSPKNFCASAVGKTGKLRRLEKGGNRIGLLDAVLQFA